MRFLNLPSGLPVVRILMDPTLSVALAVSSPADPATSLPAGVPPDSSTTAPPPNVGLIVGLTVGLTALAVLLVVGGVVLNQRHREKKAKMIVVRNAARRGDQSREKPTVALDRKIMKK